MNFYVYQQDYEDHEVHILDVYVGPRPPKAHVDSKLETFDNIEDLYTFLKSVNASQVSTFRHKLCPDELIDGLNQWIESNLILRPVVIAMRKPR